MSEPSVDFQHPRAVEILAKSMYRELRSSGMGEGEVMALASELLALVASEMSGRAAGEHAR